ncbi:glycosyltransferase family 4 protein [Gorillibacterium sp. CAU 1737]|uniref:glycosyltransferase family 4 protein n=1 Tax=Gorillibacterium sp. CAU 1737 TaxID=3140362 RepID=UPI00325FE7EC
MTSYRVFWKGPVKQPTGYGEASRHYVQALRKQGVPVRITQAGLSSPAGEGARKGSGKSVLVYHHPPHSIRLGKARNHYDRLVLNTVWETSRLPRAWVSAINRFDAVCVPSRQNQQAFRESGVKVPIYLVPHGVDAARYRTKASPLSLPGVKGKFVFLSVFTFQHRKNPETLLRAYWEEFRAGDPVVLIIKTSGFGRDDETSIRRKIEAYRSRLGIRPQDAAKVLVMGQRLSEQGLQALYARANAFVLPTRGEGVGLPFLEALASGVPVIATGWGGHLDFLHEGNGFLVNHTLQPPSRSMNSPHALAPRFRGLFAHSGQRWAEPDLAHLRKQMRKAFRSKRLCRAKGARGKADMQHWSWDRSGRWLKKAIELTLAAKRRS